MGKERVFVITHAVISIDGEIETYLYLEGGR